MAVPALPLDILVLVLEHVPVTRDDSGVLLLTSTLQTNLLFREAASVSTIWEPHYKARYRHCDNQAEAFRESRFNKDWRLMYTERRRLDSAAIQLVHNLVSFRIDRYGHAKVLYDMGFDIWDALELLSESSIPPIFVGKKQQGTTKPDLTVAFWAIAVLGTISRAFAIRLWTELLSPNNSVSFVESFSALSCFLGQSPLEISRTLDGLSEECRNFMRNKGFSLAPLDDIDLPAASSLICEFMQSEGLRLATNEEFDELLNRFPHAYLTTHKATIPISLVHIFCSIARSFGITASPVNFPRRVMAHVSSPDANVDDFFVDVSASRVLDFSTDLAMMLARQGISPQNMMDYISPCGGRTMLVRTSRNIMDAAITAPQGQNRQAVFLSLTLHMLFLGERDELAPQLMQCVDGPLDCVTVIPDTLIPISPALKVFSDEILAEEARSAPLAWRRSEQAANIRYFTGMLFVHRMFKYIGCICGWDPVCTASESWMRDMEVDKLPSGRNQPFYSILGLDGTSRYVAQVNIQPFTSMSEVIFREIYEKVSTLGQFFKGAEIGVSGRGRLLLSPDLEYAYPEDDAVGRDWVCTGRFEGG